MKKLIRFTLLTSLLLTVFGCATNSDFEAKLEPPEAMNPAFMRYKELPGQKVFVVAVDPTGQWAFSFDHSRATLEEAAHNAAVKCDKERAKHKVFTKARLFAINDEIVYRDN